jgi:hypothetical protein
VPDKKKTRTEIVAEMTQIIAKRLEAMPPEEGAKRLAAFRDTVMGDAKPASNR